MRRPLALLVGLVAIVGTFGGATASNPIIDQYVGIPGPVVCRTVPLGSLVVVPVPITAVEFCAEKIDTGFHFLVLLGENCACGTIWSPAVEWSVEPSFVRVYTPTGVIYQQYPFASAAGTVPGFCLYNNDPTYNGPLCLI